MKFFQCFYYTFGVVRVTCNNCDFNRFDTALLQASFLGTGKVATCSDADNKALAPFLRCFGKEPTEPLRPFRPSSELFDRLVSDHVTLSPPWSSSIDGRRKNVHL